jgi:hypothetical protein
MPVLCTDALPEEVDDGFLPLPPPPLPLLPVPPVLLLLLLLPLDGVRSAEEARLEVDCACGVGTAFALLSVCVG